MAQRPQTQEKLIPAGVQLWRPGAPNAGAKSGSRSGDKFFVLSARSAISTFFPLSPLRRLEKALIASDGETRGRVTSPEPQRG